MPSCMLHLSSWLYYDVWEFGVILLYFEMQDFLKVYKIQMFFKIFTGVIVSDDSHMFGCDLVLGFGNLSRLLS